MLTPRSHSSSSPPPQLHRIQVRRVAAIVKRRHRRGVQPRQARFFIFVDQTGYCCPSLEVGSDSGIPDDRRSRWYSWGRAACFSGHRWRGRWGGSRLWSSGVAGTYILYVVVIVTEFCIHRPTPRAFQRLRQQDQVHSHQPNTFVF